MASWAEFGRSRRSSLPACAACCYPGSTSRLPLCELEARHGSVAARSRSQSRALDSVQSDVASCALASGAARTVWYGPSRPAWHSKSNHYAWQLIVANRVPHHCLNSGSWLVAGVRADSTPERVSALGGDQRKPAPFLPSKVYSRTIRPSPRMRGDERRHSVRFRP